MTRRHIDPDLTRRDEGPYWAAALVIAIRAGDRQRQKVARSHLRRLGYRLDVIESKAGCKGVSHAD
jgi:hypothetical protein